MKLCNRSTQDPLLRSFSDNYSLHLLPVARENIFPGDVIINDGKNVSMPGNIRYLLQEDIDIQWKTVNESMANIVGKFSNGIDLKTGIKLLNNFLSAFHIDSVSPSIKASLDKSRTSSLRFAFTKPLRDSMDVLKFGVELIDNKIRASHPIWQDGYKYYIVTAVVKSNSISVATNSDDENKVDINIDKLKLLEVNGAVSIKKEKEGTIVFEGNKELIFGVELHEISIAKETGEIELKIPRGAVRVAGIDTTSSILSRAIISGESDEIFLHIDTPVEADHYEVDVFFATDRNKIPGKETVRFGNARSGLTLGICKVNIPANKKMGELPRPDWWKLQFKPQLKKHVALLSTTEVLPVDFFSLVKEKVTAAKDNDAFVFVHGFNVTFEECVLRGAQMSFDIGFEGAPIVYSWPSKGNLQGYLSDEDNVQYTNTHLVNFLKDVKSKTGASRINLIAHSMGNRALTKALIDLNTEGFFKDFEFNQIILAAPDIDAQIFKNEILPQMTGCSKRITLYASSKDKALSSSRLLRANVVQRLGETHPSILCTEGIDSIDASRIDTNLIGHGYFIETSKVLNDIYLLLKHNHPPEMRNLMQKINHGNNYWTFK